MSERLREMVQRKIVKLGKNGVAQLASTSGVSFSTVVNVKNGGRNHSSETVRRLALACGCTDLEAEDMVLALLRDSGAA